MIFFRVCRFICWIVAKVYFRFQAFQVEHIPKTEGAIIACNHVSFLDPPLSGIALKRPTHFFARNTLMKNAFTKWFYRKLNCIPVNRDKLDTKTFRSIVHLVQSGQILVIFPEGTRSRSGELQEGKQGTGMIVAHANVPVIPCYIDGAAAALPRGTSIPKPKKIRVIYGQPMRLSVNTKTDKKTAYVGLSNQIMGQIKQLQEQVKTIDKL